MKIVFCHNSFNTEGKGISFIGITSFIYMMFNQQMLWHGYIGYNLLLGRKEVVI